MNTLAASPAVLLATLAFGLASALLAWSAMRIAGNALARYRERFTAEAHLQLEELFLFMDPARLFVLNLLAVTVGSVGTWLVSGEPLLALASAGALALQGLDDHAGVFRAKVGIKNLVFWAGQPDGHTNDRSQQPDSPANGSNALQWAHLGPYSRKGVDELLNECRHVPLLCA